MASARRARAVDFLQQRNQRREGAPRQSLGALLNNIDARAHLAGARAVTRQAGASGILAPARGRVHGEMDGAAALARHVTIGAGRSAARMHTLAPHLELGMLRFENRGAGFGVVPIAEPGLVV